MPKRNQPGCPCCFSCEWASCEQGVSYSTNTNLSLENAVNTANNIHWKSTVNPWSENSSYSLLDTLGSGTTVPYKATSNFNTPTSAYFKMRHYFGWQDASNHFYGEMWLAYDPSVQWTPYVDLISVTSGSPSTLASQTLSVAYYAPNRIRSECCYDATAQTIDFYAGFSFGLGGTVSTTIRQTSVSVTGKGNRVGFGAGYNGVTNPWAGTNWDISFTALRRHDDCATCP